jgi:hypothetical protein
MPNAPQPLTGRGRDRALDVLRGYAIVAMITSHVGGLTRINALFNLPLWLSAADGFVLLSGATAGLLAAGDGSREQRPIEFGRWFRRARALYVIHLVLTLIVLFVHELFGRLQAPSVSALGGWAAALLGVVTLRVQPLDYMNILPLFVIFLLLAPFALELCRRRKTAWLLLASALVWGLSQWQPSSIPLPRPSEEPLIFSLGAWQFAFFVGLTLGFHQRAIAQALGNNPWLARSLLAMTLALFLLAQAQRAVLRPLHLTLPASWEPLLSKQTWGALHAVYATLVVGVGYALVRQGMAWQSRAFSRVLQPLLAPALGALESIGRVSLRCFVLHLPFALLASAFDTWHRARWFQELFTGGSIAATYALARSETLARILRV